MRTALRLLAGLTLTASAVCGWAAPAAAHTVMVGSSPQSWAQLAVAPESVSLTFAQPIGSEFVAVTVTASDGASWTSGEPSVVADTVTQPLRPLSDGAYVAAYRVVSPDGHPVSGRVTFIVLPSAEPATAGDAPVDDALPAEEVIRAERASSVTVEPGRGSGMQAPLAGAGAVGLLIAAGAVAARRRARTAVPSCSDGRS